jgi:hypothetical protein
MPMILHAATMVDKHPATRVTPITAFFWSVFPCGGEEGAKGAAESGACDNVSSELDFKRRRTHRLL